ncbi:MAG: nucleotidyltransferase family protein [Armatimonadetes bacterium]|nr:nucleotidyltransferase family protein [Armatimonadota bacterium]
MMASAVAASLLDESEVALFGCAIAALRDRGIPFLVVGAHAVYQYTGVWRNTKDLDLAIVPGDRKAAVETLRDLGLNDYFVVEAYDQEWIFRAHAGSVIVDLIWMFANKVARVSADWFRRARPGWLAGEAARFAAPEDLIWMKLMVLQRGRCDWPDLLNIIRGTHGRLDWQLLLANVGPHWPLLRALIQVYDWLCPAEHSFIPAPFRAILEERARAMLPGGELCRAALLDWRPWLAAPGEGALS